MNARETRFQSELESNSCKICVETKYEYFTGLNCNCKQP